MTHNKSDSLAWGRTRFFRVCASEVNVNTRYTNK